MSELSEGIKMLHEHLTEAIDVCNGKIKPYMQIRDAAEQCEDERWKAKRAAYTDVLTQLRAILGLSTPGEQADGQ